MSSQDETFPATWQGGHALIIEFGDEELYGMCQCAIDKPLSHPAQFGSMRPNGSLDVFGQKWERHVITLGHS